ncbi:MAG TPA: hypothetical protein DCO72_10485 [Ruminococcus sp.]|nr:hypothetical protein [Ruminococcus sp.]
MPNLSLIRKAPQWGLFHVKSRFCQEIFVKNINFSFVHKMLLKSRAFLVIMVATSERSGNMKLHQIAVACLAVCLMGSAVPLADIGEIPAIVAKAEELSGTCGTDASWNFDSETGVLTISGTGEVDNSLWTSNPSMRGLIKQIVIEEGITNLKDGVFAGCVNMTDVTIPQTLTNLGSGIFSSCYQLTSIEFPDNITSIGDGAFYQCGALTHVKLPARLEQINAGVFSMCSALTSVEIPEGVKIIGGSAFSDCNSLASVNIPESVTTIDSGAFNNCRALKEIQLPAGLNSIGSGAFYGCAGLTSLNIHEGITNMGISCFAGCTSLSSVVFPAGMTTIEESAFSGCSSLASVTIPDSVISIKAGAFANCFSIRNVFYGGSVRTWNLIDIGSENEKLTNATLHFSSMEALVSGDVNYDGNLTVSDLVQVAQSLYRRHPLPRHCDMNGDNNVNVIDFALLKKALLDK